MASAKEANNLNVIQQLISPYDVLDEEVQLIPEETANPPTDPLMKAWKSSLLMNNSKLKQFPEVKEQSGFQPVFQPENEEQHNVVEKELKLSLDWWGIRSEPLLIKEIFRKYPKRPPPPPPPVAPRVPPPPPAVRPVSASLPDKKPETGLVKKNKEQPRKRSRSRSRSPEKSKNNKNKNDRRNSNTRGRSRSRTPEKSNKRGRRSPDSYSSRSRSRSRSSCRYSSSSSSYNRSRRRSSRKDSPRSRSPVASRPAAQTSSLKTTATPSATTKPSGNNSQEEHPILGKVDSLARTQNGSRLVQNAIINGNKSVRQQIFEEIRPSLVSLMTDLFGNYVVQVMVDNATDEQLATIVPLLEGQMINLSEDKKSNYVIQKIIQMACKIVSTTNQMDVKDRLLTFMRNTMDSLSSNLKRLCCHQSGSRIVQVSVKQFPELVDSKMIRAFLTSFDSVVKDLYGVTVLQEALKAVKSEEFFDSIRSKIELKIIEFSLDLNASLFMESYLEIPEYRRSLFWKLVKPSAGSFEPATIIQMLKNSNSYFTVKKLIELADEEQLQFLDRFSEENRELIARQGFGADFMTVLREKVNKLTKGKGFRQQEPSSSSSRRNETDYDKRNREADSREREREKEKDRDHRERDKDRERERDRSHKESSSSNSYYRSSHQESSYRGHSDGNSSRRRGRSRSRTPPSPSPPPRYSQQRRHSRDRDRR
jgi:hypothetical protein